MFGDGSREHRKTVEIHHPIKPCEHAAGVIVGRDFGASGTSQNVQIRWCEECGALGRGHFTPHGLIVTWTMAKPKP